MRSAICVLVSWFAAACASAPVRGPMPPVTLTAPVSPDSAIRLVAVALAAERLPIDGDSLVQHQRAVSSTFEVRKGGLGQATIRFRLHATGDGPDSSFSRISFDATAEERGRAFEFAVENPREPRRLRGPHPLNPNDREVRGRLASLLDRLAGLGIR